MSILEIKINALMRFCAAETEDAREEALADIREIMKNQPDQPSELTVIDKDRMIRKVLLELGVPDHLPGWLYLVDAISMVVDDQDIIKGIVNNVYFPVAEKHRVSFSKCEKAARYAIEVAWTRADVEILRKYFGGIIDLSRGKPTLREFIVRVSNIVRTGV